MMTNPGAKNRGAKKWPKSNVKAAPELLLHLKKPTSFFGKPVTTQVTSIGDIGPYRAPGRRVREVSYQPVLRNATFGTISDLLWPESLRFV